MARTRGAFGKTYVPAADRFVHQFSGDRAVDATANGADNATSFSADLTYASNLLSYKLFLYVCCGGEVEIRARTELLARTMVQSLLHPQMLSTNREMTSFPRGECVTSGWNWMP